jgi:hypothetical protein
MKHYLSFDFFQPLKIFKKNILRPQIIQKQMVSQIWHTGHSLPILGLYFYFGDGILL